MPDRTPSYSCPCPCICTCTQSYQRLAYTDHRSILSIVKATIQAHCSGLIASRVCSVTHTEDQLASFHLIVNLALHQISQPIDTGWFLNAHASSTTAHRQSRFCRAHTRGPATSFQWPSEHEQSVSPKETSSTNNTFVLDPRLPRRIESDQAGHIESTHTSVEQLYTIAL